MHTATTTRRMALGTTLVTVLLAAGVTGAPAPGGAAPGALRDVLLVGNNWDGTVDVVDVATLQRVRRVNVVPDLDQRTAEINADPIRWAAVQLFRSQIGEGHDQLVDDAYPSVDGTEIYVSRPSLGDVVAIVVATGQIRWRTRVEGYRSDHMGLAPDGTRLVVSASTAKVAQVIDTATGRVAGSFATGDQPHENLFTRDGGRILNASIGSVYTALDDPWLDWTKGDRYLQIVDATTLRQLRKIDIGDKLAAFGRSGLSSAVRPSALSPDERFLYLQVSFLHGFVEYDLQQDLVTRVADLPVLGEAVGLPRTGYLLDSAHHGIAMSGDGTKFCVAGTMSNYAAIVDRASFAYQIHPLGPGARTYWATSSADGRLCYVSVAGDDTVSVLSYATGQEVARIPVGDHPQRARTGRLLASLLGAAATDLS